MTFSLIPRKLLWIGSVLTLFLAAGAFLWMPDKAHSHCDALNPERGLFNNFRHSSAQKTSKEAFKYCKRFLQIDAELPDYTPSVADQPDRYEVVKTYGWHIGRVLRAYHDMYEVTGDIHFLEMMIEDIDVVKQDSRLRAWGDDPSQDYYGWPIAKRGGFLDETGEPYYVRHVVISAMTLYPIAQLVQTFTENPDLNAQLPAAYQDRKEGYLELILNVVNSHNMRFCYGLEKCGSKDEDGYRVSDKVKVSGGEAFYYTDANDAPSYHRNLNLPHNQQLAMGSVLSILWALDASDSANPQGEGKNDYRAMIEGMGQVFINDLELATVPNSEREYYKWGYWWGQSKARCSSCGKYEDIGHAAIDIEFVTGLQKQGLNIGSSIDPFPVGVFGEVADDSDKDLRRFADTFTDIIYLGDFKFSKRVDGEVDRRGILAPEDLTFIMEFLALADWDRDFLNFKASYASHTDWGQNIEGRTYPNKIYSIVKCTYENKLNTAISKNMLQGVAKLTKWAVTLNDNDSDFDLQKRCNAIKVKS